ncbi:hypothetical protein PCE1_002706 [Barthelona sp. PCE]
MNVTGTLGKTAAAWRIFINNVGSTGFWLLFSFVLLFFVCFTVYLLCDRHRVVTTYYCGVSGFFYTLLSIQHPLLHFPLLEVDIAVSLHISVYLTILLSGVVSKKGDNWIVRGLTFPGYFFINTSLLWLVLLPLTVFLPEITIMISVSLGGYGFFQAINVSYEKVTLLLDQTIAYPSLQRLKTNIGRQHDPKKPTEETKSPLLEILHLADLDVGPFLSCKRCARTIAKMLVLKPDMVVFTGDLASPMMSQSRSLHKALVPLKSYNGPKYAVLGNKDHYNKKKVIQALETVGFIVLSDSEDVVSITRKDGTDINVQVLGSAFHTSDPQLKIRRLCKTHAPKHEHFRLLLSHTPELFHHLSGYKHLNQAASQSIPSQKRGRFLIQGDAGTGCDLVLAGHTHGGFWGLSSLFNAINLVSKIPSRGFWANGTSRMYVSRGLGCCGAPMRLGISPEISLLSIQ